MQILTIILAVIICIILYCFVYKKAQDKAKDLFEWGCYTGIVIALVIDIAFMFI